MPVNVTYPGVYTQGAFFSYYVSCGASTTTSADIEEGIVNVIVGFVPVQPAEFVVLYFQLAAQKVDA